MLRLQKKTVRRSLNIGAQLLFRTLFMTLREDFYVNKCLIYLHYENFWIIPPTPPEKPIKNGWWQGFQIGSLFSFQSLFDRVTTFVTTF